ncbi:MAG TPA: hypothetical protein VN380_01965 [Thermoanaerobaculia bacterium]|nr:hypothetical protein [Thermoanaerobaculia bacterium]
MLLAIIASTAFAQIAGERPVSAPLFYAPVSSSGSPAIASDGTSFLAVWCDGRDGGDVNRTQGDLYAARIDSDGTILDPLGIFITSTYGPLGVAWNGDAYVVIWSTFSPPVVMAARISPDGRVVDPPHVIVPGAYLTSDRHTIASNGNVTVVLTSGGYSVLDKDLRVIDSGARSSNVAPNASGVFTNGSGGFILTGNGGLRLDGTGHPTASGLQPSSIGGVIACHGNECLQVFDLGYGSNLNAASYDPATGSHTPAVGLSIPSGDGFYDVVATSDGYLLLSGTGVVQRFDGQHNPLGPPTSLSWPGSAGVAAASNGHNTAVLRSTNPVSIALMTPSSAGDLRNLATSANAQRDPAIATDGSTYLVAWEENDGIYAGRLSLDGTALDGRGRRIATSTSAPVVAYDGASYLVSVGDRSQTTMVRIDPSNGATLATHTLCGDGMRIVAGNGTAHIAVWANCGDIAAAFIDANGTPASAPVTIATPPSWSQVQNHPAVAWNGTMWLVTWEEQVVSNCALDPPNCPAPTFALRGARLSAALTPIDTKPITISENYTLSGSTRLASDGHDFLASWSSLGAVHVRRISALGEAFDDQSLFTGTAQDLIWDGAQYDLAFVSQRPDLAVAHLRPSGQAFETFLISATTDDKRNPALVSLGTGRVVAAYTRLGHESLYRGVPRAFMTTPRPARGRAAR